MTIGAPLRDQGLQPERTVLAWSRTALAVIGNAMLLLRSGIEHSSPMVLATGMALVVAAVCVLRQGERRRDQLRSVVLGAPDASAPMLIATAALLACVCGTLVIAGAALIP